MLSQYNSNMEVGLDEAGRGPLIGRVYAGAVIWPSDTICDMIKDSKKLSIIKREKSLNWIKENIVYWGVGFADENEIDSINILNATKLAMDRAIINLQSKDTSNLLNITNLIIDGTGWENKFSNYTVNSIVKGDSKYYSIAAASIIAKQYHDKYISELVLSDPSLDIKYNLLKNMGYGTKKHIDGIKQHGMSQYHRKSFNIK